MFCFPKHLSTLTLQVHTEDIVLHDLFYSMTVLSSLARLHLCTCGDNNEMSLAWRHLRSLESLHLQGFKFAPAWASDLSCLTKLTLLSFAGLDEPVPLHELASLPALQTLHLKSHCEPANEHNVVDLDNLPDLPPTMRELRVVGLQWDRELSSLRGLASLRVCMLHGIGPVSLPAHMLHLHTLVLDCNGGLVLEDYLTGFTALRLLSLRKCGAVAVPSSFNQLAALPHLTCIDVAGSLPVNHLDWSAYAGLPLHGTGCEQQSREQPSDHRDGNSGKTGQDATHNAQVVSVAQPMARRICGWPDSWPNGQARDGGVPGSYDAPPYLVYEGMIMYYDL